MRRLWQAVDVNGHLWEFDPRDGAPVPYADRQPLDLSQAGILVGSDCGPGRVHMSYQRQVTPDTLKHYVNTAHLVCWWVIEKEDY